MVVRDEDFAAVTRLWRELSAFPAAPLDGALEHCLRGVAALLDATNVIWVAGVREDGHPPDDALGGWRPRAVKYLHFSEEREERFATLLRDLHASQVDPMTLSNLALAGRNRAALRRELVEDAVWFASRLYTDVLRPLGVEDRLMATFTIDEQHESYFAVDRGPDQARFAGRERDLLLLFTTGVPGLHRELFRAHGLLDARAALSARERDVLRLLLTDRGEREIALELGLAESTVHQYVVSILRTYRVKGRVGLMAHWLAQSPASSASPTE